MRAKFTDTCTVGLPPDIEQAWALRDIATKYAGPFALAGKLLGLILPCVGLSTPESLDQENEDE
jgi:hypothetical protein